MADSTTIEFKTQAILKAALHYESLGWFVLPLEPIVKKPLVKWEHRADRRPDQAEIKKWFGKWKGARVGIVTGLSGLTSVDFDDLGDMERFRECVADCDSPFVIETGRDGGGYHKLFKATPDLQKKMGKKQIGYDMDLLVNHSLEVVPPSGHKSGKQYKWSNLDPMDLDPETFADELPELPAAAVNHFKGCEKDDVRLNGDDAGLTLDPDMILQGVPEGERDDTLFRFACRYRGKNLTLSEARVLILQAAAQCSPPFPEKDALVKLKQAYKFDAPADPVKSTSTFKLTKLSDIEIKPPDYLVYKLMERDSTVLIFSPPGEAKTFMAIDFCCCIATGEDFHGRFVKQGPVVFVAGEGQNGLKRRFTAWSIRHQIDLDTAPIFISTMPTGLCDAEQVDHVNQAIQAVADEYGKPAMVVFDTVARNFGPGDENSTKDMSAFINGADKIRGQFKCCVMLVHHSGHADRSRGRGSMALKGALDVEYRLEKDETGVVRMQHAKPPKDFEPPPPMAFRLNTVELPFKDDEGNPVTSAILDDTEYMPPPVSGKQGRGKWQTVATEVLKGLYKKHRLNLDTNGYDVEGARVLMEDWRRACMDKGMTRVAWKRIKDNLKWNPDVHQDGAYVQILSDDTL